MSLLKGVICIVCFNRPTELEIVIQAVENSKLSNQQVLIVCQRGNSEVERIVNSLDENSFKKVFTPKISSESVKSIINRNVYTAFYQGFSNNADYVVLIEDDIEVHPSFLTFVDQIHKVEENNNEFRAVNGFSAAQEDPALKNGYGKYRFGVGWGWSMSSRIWNDLTSIWHGNEDAHWDGLIEPFMRTGFVVMPNTSLIKNLGLNGKGANSGDDPVLSLAIEKSFRIENNFLGTAWAFNQSDIKWREDCFAYVPPINVRGVFIDKLFRLLYLFRAKNELPITTNRIRAHLKAAIFRIIRRMV